MTRLLAIAALLTLPATANEPIRIYLDGQLIGTHALIEFRLGEDEIHITTNEQVYGCQQAVIYQDRFEGFEL